jgi:sensor c-di-GMP phosphodiesterase-like protein
MMLAIIMLGLVTVAALVAVAILLTALDTARDNEREALRQLAEERARLDYLRASVNSAANEQHGIRSEAAKKGHQTRKRRLVVARVMQQDMDVQTMIGGAN